MSHCVLTVLTAAALLASGCASSASGGSGSRSTTSAPATSTAARPAEVRLVSGDVPRMPAGDPTAAGAAVTGFGTSLWGELPTGGNLVISPYSVYVALAMTRQGASGEVAAQLDTLLQSPDAAAAVTAVDEALAAAQPVDAPPGAPAPQISPANSLWVQDGAIAQPFLDRVGAGFGAGVHLVDYAADQEAARSAINGWVADHTEALIPELIPPGILTEKTVLTLVNALYFAGEWGVAFTETQDPLPFTTVDGATVEAPAFGAVKPFATAAGDGWRSVTLPYLGYATAMTLIVPDAGRLDAVEEALDADLIAAAVAGEPTSLDLTVPTFSLDSPSDLENALKALGATEMFEWSVWPELNPAVDSRVSAVVHQAVVDTDEKGTVAAAATAVMMESASAQPTSEEFTVDRPFFFVIHDTTTNAPLFLGRVLDPTA